MVNILNKEKEKRKGRELTPKPTFNLLNFIFKCHWTPPSRRTDAVWDRRAIWAIVFKKHCLCSWNKARVLRQYRATPVCNNKVMWRDEPNWSGGKNFSVYSSPLKRYLNTAFVGKFQFQLNTAKMKMKIKKTKTKNKIRVFTERLWKYFLISNLKPQAAPKCSTTEIITSIGHQAKVKPYLQ